MATSHHVEHSSREGELDVAARALILSSVVLPFSLAYALRIPVCGLAALAHVPCPGCGLTRATIALFRGDLLGAFALNPLAPVVCPILVAVVVVVATRFLMTGRMPSKLAPFAWIVGVSLGGLVAVWTARWFGFFGGPLPL